MSAMRSDPEHLNQEVESWQTKIKDARQTGDPTATLALAETAADAIEEHVGKPAEWTHEEREALKAVKRWTYNAAADVWPGWEVDGPVIDEATLVKGQALAERSFAWVEELALGSVQEGTGVWLIGAFDLALGQLDDAVLRFSAGSKLSREGGAPGLALLADGYLVIAQGLKEEKTNGEIEEELDKVTQEIAEADLENGPGFTSQLRTALKVFIKK